MYEVTDDMIVAARRAIERRQQSLVGKITKASMRDALNAADEVRHDAAFPETEVRDG